MLIYACWSPICVAGPSGLYSGVLLQAHTGTDKNTDTNIFQFISKMDVYSAGLTISVWHAQLTATLLVKLVSN